MHSFIQIKGDEIVSLSYSLSKEYRVREEKNKSSCTDIALSTVSIVGDMKITKGLEKAGKIAGWISNIKFASGLISSYKKDIFNCAIEELTCTLFMYELASDSPELSAKLYIFAKKKMNQLFYSGKLNLDYDLTGGIINYTFVDSLDIELIRNDLNNYKKEIKYGLSNE